MENGVRQLSFSPLYYGDRLHIVNPQGDVGLVTLWSPVTTAMRIISQALPTALDREASRVAVVSNLYGDGMHQMLCNLLYNPQVRHIIAIGETLGLPTVAEFEALLAKGVQRTVVLGTEVNRIEGTDRVLPILKYFDLDRLRKTLTFRYLGRLGGEDLTLSLSEYLDRLPRYERASAAERVRVEIPPAFPDNYTYRPSEVLGHQISRATPLRCWEELVTRTVRFGHPVQLRAGPRLELLNTRVVITDPVEESESALEEYGFSLERFHDYQGGMFDPNKPPDIDYTYGNRLSGYWTQNGELIDALDLAAQVLTDNPDSRNGFISLWDTAQDLGTQDASTPCLVTLFVRRAEGRLTLTATYRAHNLLTAWMQNVYGLIAIQRELCRRTGMPPGAITVISHSLGIDPRSPRYEIAKNIAKGWTRDDDIDERTGRPVLREDPNGYFVVTVDESVGEMVAEHRFGPFLIKQYRGTRAAKIEREIIGDMAVSLVSHALWLGRELMAKEELLHRGQRRARRKSDDA